MVDRHKTNALVLISLGEFYTMGRVVCQCWFHFVLYHAILVENLSSGLWLMNHVEML